MPRFSTKSMLVAVAVLALWLSTFAGYWGALDVQKSILLCIFLTAGFAALYKRGKRRAFWAGFFVVMFACGGMSFQQPLNRYTPDLTWQSRTTNGDGPMYRRATSGFLGLGNGTSKIALTPAQPNLDANISATIAAAWTLALSLLVGYIAAYIYVQSQQNKDG